MKYTTYILMLTTIATGASLAQAAETSTVSEKPQAIKVVEPEVPYEMTRWEVKGEVTVSFTINEQGQPENVSVQSSDNTVYSEKVLEAVQQWRFAPPKTAGVTYVQTIKFS